MLDCWKMNPMTRPSFTELATRIGDLLQDGTKSVSCNLIFLTKFQKNNYYIYILFLFLALYEFK